MNLGEFRGEKVLIVGLGLHGGGVGAAAFFARLGSRVTVTDLKTSELAPSIAKLRRFKNITYRLGGHRPADFRTADYVIKGPGVPKNSKFLKIARRAGVPVLSDVEIFFLVCPAPIIGITGTKGKSTAASLLFELLGTRISRGSRAAPWVRPSRIRRGSRAWLGGNIRNSVLEFLPRVRKNDWVVLELSSFQLDSLKNSRRSPHIALITNIFPDHLNRYPSMAAYVTSKANIFRYQKRGDYLFINANDRLLRRTAASAPGRVVRFDPGRTVRPFAKLIRALPTYHIPNISGAIAVAKHLGVGERVIRKVLTAFRGLPGRMEFVRRVRGVEFINDTTATNPTAAEQAVVATKKRIGKHGGLHVIAGGYDKGLPVEEFVNALAGHTASVIFLPGTATKKMEARIMNHESWKPNVHHASLMTEAVRIAYAQAKRGDAVLLSPGAASFGLFRHEFDRGDQFVRAVRNLETFPQIHAAVLR